MSIPQEFGLVYYLRNLGRFIYFLISHWILVILSLIWPFPDHNFILPHNAKFTLSMVKPCRQVCFLFSGSILWCFWATGKKGSSILHQQWSEARLYNRISFILFYEFMKQLKRGFEILLTGHTYTKECQMVLIHLWSS